MRIDKRIAKIDIIIDGKVIVKKGQEVCTSSIEQSKDGSYYITVFCGLWFKDDPSNYDLLEVDTFNKSKVKGCSPDKNSMEYLNKQLQHANDYDLMTEVVVWALIYAQAHKDATIKECIDYGIENWIK